MSRPLYEHIQRRKELVEKCEDMLNEAKAKGNSELSPTRAAQVEAYMEEIKEINELVEEELCNWKSSEPILESPRNSMPMGRLPFGNGDEFSIPKSIKAASKTYRGMFYGDNKAKINNGGFATFDDFLYAIHAGRADQRLIQCTMVEGAPSLGGFAVPEEYGAFLMDESLENEIIRPRATIWGMGSATKKVPAFDGAEHGNGLFGGITGQWLAEGETGIKSHGKLRLIQLIAKKLACFSQASNELIADGMSFEEMLARALIKAVGWYMDYAFIHGNGEDEPLGILNDESLVTVEKAEGQTAGTITYQNVVDMFSRLAPNCFANAVWIANPSVIPQLLTMTISIGTGGAQIPVLREENGKFTLLGKEVVFTEKCPALGFKGDLILADLSQYAIGMRKEIALDRSNVPGWTEDMTDYRVIVRVDGKGTWDKPLAPVNGTSLSWAVALEDRNIS